MNRRALHVVIGFTVLLILTAGLLLRVRSNYILGKPALKLADVPIYNDETNIVSNTSVYLPERVGEYVSRRLEPISVIEQNWLPPDTLYGRRIYTAPDRFQVLISVVMMGTDRTSIHKPQYCLVGQGEQIVKSEVITVPISDPQTYELKVMKLSTRSQRRTSDGQFVPMSGVFMYWFVADGHLTPHHEERMWLMGKELISSGLLQRWAYVAYFANCPPGQEDLLAERVKSFIAQSVPEFQLTTGAREVAKESAPQKIAQN